jgi:hypothetical protein
MTDDIDIEPADTLYDAKTVAELTGRHLKLIHRWQREGRIRSVPDPTDGRRKLIPSTELLVIAKIPQVGTVKREITFTRMRDGSTFTRVIAVKKPRD